MQLVTQLKLNQRTDKFLWSVEFQHQGSTLMEVQSEPFLLKDQKAFTQNFERVQVRALKELNQDPKFTALILTK